jgi:hypothetical protein
VDRQDVLARRPGTATAHVFVIRTHAMARPLPAPEVARALKAARASGAQIADAGEVLRSIKIRLDTLDQGE